VGTEIWQFALAAAAGAVVIVLWILFVYLPRRTGEDAPRAPSEEDRSHDHEGGPRE
jgi:hypothetical protein